jgi:hypothetical protein
LAVTLGFAHGCTTPSRMSRLSYEDKIIAHHPTRCGNLYASHRVVHIHANNYGGMGVVGGYAVPCVLEVTLARLDISEFEASDETFPTAMDMPCNKDAADIYLGRFDFA